MKKSLGLLLLMVLLGMNNSFAQAGVNTEECLLKQFKQSELNAMSADELDYQRFIVDNAMQVYPIPEDKPKDIYPTKKWIVDANTCIYDLNVKIQAEERIYFFSKNGMLVMIYSEKELKQNYARNK
jgi:hypothetical protein